MLSFLKRRREARRPRCAALVVAAGQSSRMGGTNKLLMELDGVPVLARTLISLQLSVRVDEIVVAAREEDIPEIQRLCQQYGIDKCKQVVKGGENRVRSALLAAMAASRNAALLAVHDGARPLLTPGLADRVIHAAEMYGAAAPALPMKDTIKRVREEKDNQVAETVERSTLRAVQTPQVFYADLLKAALQAADEAGVTATDDCAAVERLGKTVYLVPGEEENLKITTPLDMVLALAILENRKAGNL